MKVTENNINQYKKEGWLSIPKLIRKSATNELLYGFVQILQRISPNVFPNESNNLSWRSHELSSALIKFRSEDPNKFSIFYDSLQTSYALQRIFSSNIIAETVAALLNEPIETISMTDFILRMDPPDDTRNRLEWHQDSSYFINNISGDNGVVCFISLSGANEEEGALEICPQSQRERRIKVSQDKGENLTSHQYLIPQKYIKKYSIVKVLCKSGNASFFNMDLIHRSGLNTSERFRFTAIARFHRMSTHDHIPGRMIYMPNKEVLNTLMSAQ